MSYLTPRELVRYVAPETNEYTFPAEVYHSYKISMGIFYACESDMSFEGLGLWREHIAIPDGGMFLGFPKAAFRWTSPTIINPIK